MEQDGRTGFLATLSARERVMVLALILTFFVMGSLLLLYLRSEALSARRAAIDEHRRALEQVHVQGPLYQELVEERRTAESSIADTEIQFNSLLEKAQVGLSEEFSVQDIDTLPAKEVGRNLIKKTFTFRLRSVHYQDAITFLTKLESEPDRILLVEEFKIRSTNEQNDAVNFDVTVATWERLKVEEETSDAEQPKSGSGSRARGVQ